MRFGYRNTKRSLSLTPMGCQLVSEVEAFLSGDNMDWLQRRGCAVPGWAWLNRFAHSELHDVRSIAERQPNLPALSSSKIGNSWQTVSQIIAKDLLEQVDDDPLSLCLIQQMRSIPLELRPIEVGAAFGLLQSTRSAIRADISKEDQQ